MEVYKDRMIAYSVGQCGFDMKSDDFDHDAIAVEIPLTRNGFANGVIRPIGNSVWQPELRTIDEGRSRLEWVARQSRPFGTRWRTTEDTAKPVLRGGRATFA